MVAKMQIADADVRDRELDAEIVGILTAISIVSKRLAKRISALQEQCKTGGDAGA